MTKKALLTILDGCGVGGRGSLYPACPRYASTCGKGRERLGQESLGHDARILIY